jgi:methylated-DNA-[protein]-cysteine S-methyltransferase
MTKTPSDFAKKVYQLTKRVPKGRVTTYKAIAKALNTKAYRAIGQILSVNPMAPTVPCHRVVASSGELNGFNGSKSQRELSRKSKLLMSEGVKVKNNRIVNFQALVFHF